MHEFLKLSLSMILTFQLKLSSVAFASTQTNNTTSTRTPTTANSKSTTTTQTQAQANLTLKQKLKLLKKKQTNTNDHFIFDLPMTYNKKVATWISFFQTHGKNFFRNWLEKSTKYMPLLQSELKKAGLPTDLAYIVMIESGFSATAVSTAKAINP